MKFSAFKEFRNLIGATVQDVGRYLQVDLTKTLRELAVGLNRLTFEDNFECFVVNLTIPANSELQIRNQLIGAIPSQRIILKGGDASNEVVDGDTEWTEDFVYLKNLNGSTAAVVTVAFLK